MEKFKLIGMTDFVLEQNNTMPTYGEGLVKDSSAQRAFYKCLNYANFLKRPLKLEIFVPCDDEGNVLEEVEKGRDKLYDSQDTSADSQQYHQQWHMRINQYQQAKKKVLFEGFEYRQEGYVRLENGIIFDDERINSKTIEDLIRFELYLTENAIKQIGL